MTKKKKWHRVELPSVDVAEVSRAFYDAVSMQCNFGHPDTIDARVFAMRSLKSRVLRVLRAVRDGRVYRKR